MVAAGQKCERCKADIVWLKTTKGAWMPVDAASVEAGDTIYDPKKHVAHWGTCPHAKEFRKKHPDPPKSEEPTITAQGDRMKELVKRCREKGIIK